MGDNNGDIKKSQKVCHVVHSDFDLLSHLESTALSTVRGVKIFSLTVSWRKKTEVFSHQVLCYVSFNHFDMCKGLWYTLLF